MEESRDPAIKLFGKTIPLRPSGEAPTIYGEEGGGNGEKDLVNIGADPDSKHQDDDSPNPQDRSELTTSFMVSQAQEQSADHDTPVKNSEPDEQENDASKSQEETPKKPDKILPCPRCKSLDTKFCYFNNYNANQPRHFCKNCQRYWTAGGTMRNVPVGAGRRKNKNTASHYRTITVSDAILQTVRPDIPDPIRHPPLKASGTVLNFGSDVPLCESMASVLKDPEKTNNCIRNGFHRTEDQMAPLPVVENGDEHSSGSSVTASSSIDDGTGDNSQQPAIQNHQGFAPQIPYFNGSPWPYHWAPAPFCSSSFPMSFYPPTAYWGCTAPGTWSIPWLSPPLASFPINGSSESGPNSPTLGKHSREGDELKHSNSDNRESLDQSKQERSLWMPKTLRIDDPEAAAAAKSSIWATMGFKNDKADATNAGGLFKSFHEKDNVKNHMAETPQVFHANPAALSRSLNFQESSY